MYKVGDKFYYSLRGTTLKSENDYCEKNNIDRYQAKATYISSFIDNINEKSREFHIKNFEILSVSNSLSKDYSINISEPKIKFVKSYKVKEV